MKSFEIISIFTCALSRLVPKKRDRWIFGAWFGSAVSDNTKALYDYVSTEHPEIERIWVASDPGKVNLPGCRVIRRNSFVSLKYIMTAQVAVMNQGFGDFAAYHFLGGAYKVQLWHGVAWKRIGRDAYPELRGIYDKIFQMLNSYDLYIAPSRAYGETVKSAFKTDDDSILYTGQPRNEKLFSERFRAKSREILLKKCGVQNKKIVVYMPTFRDKTADVFSFHRLEDKSAFQDLAGKYGFVIVEKLHYKSGQKKNDTGEADLVFSMPDIDAETLLGAADILITDYSSCFFDYLITDRPIIHYAYDYEYYRDKDRGLYYDISEVAAGTVARTPEELLAALEKSLTDDDGAVRRQMIRERFITYESDHSCRDVFERICRSIG